MSPGGKAGSILAVLPSYRDIRGTEGASSPFAIPPGSVYRLSKRSPPDPFWGQHLRSTLGNMFRSSAAGSPLFVA